MDSFDHLEFEEGERLRPAAPSPEAVPAAFSQARLLREAGRFLEAAHHYERAVGIDDHHYQARCQWVDSLVRGGKASHALTVAEASLKQYRKVRLLYAAHALALAHNQQIAEALSASDISLEGSPSAYAASVRAEILVRVSGAFTQEARHYVAQAMAFDGLAWEPCYLAGAMLLDAKLPALAAGYFSEAIHARPQACAGWAGLAKAFEDARLYDQALFYYQKLQEFDPNSPAGIAGQRRCAPRRFGLLRAFLPEDLRKRWRQRLQKELQQ